MCGILRTLHVTDSFTARSWTSRAGDFLTCCYKTKKQLNEIAWTRLWEGVRVLTGSLLRSALKPLVEVYVLQLISDSNLNLKTNEVPVRSSLCDRRVSLKWASSVINSSFQNCITPPELLTEWGLQRMSCFLTPPHRVQIIWVCIKPIVIDIIPSIKVYLHSVLLNARDTGCTHKGGVSLVHSF